MSDVGELDVLLGESMNVLTQNLIMLLSATLEVPGISEEHICALEIFRKNPDQVTPVMDLGGREVLNHAQAESDRNSGRLRMMGLSSLVPPSC